MKWLSSCPIWDSSQISAHGQAKETLLTHAAYYGFEALPGRCHALSMVFDYSN